MLDDLSPVLKMDCSESNTEESVKDDPNKEQIRKKNVSVPHYINLVLAKYRDNVAERLNLVTNHTSSVQAQPIDTSVTAGITAALRFNQWFIATTLCSINISERFYLPKQILLNLLHRVLQTHENGELSNIMKVLKKHICLHPLSYPKDELQELYTSVLVEQCREMLYDNTKSLEGLVVQVLTQLEQISQTKQVESDSNAKNVSTEDPDQEEQDVAQLPLYELVHAMESCQVYKELSSEEKLTRLGLVLNFAVDILEQDFLAWHGSQPRWPKLRTTLQNHKERPLIVALAWPRAMLWRIGTCNAFCRRVTQILWADKLQEPLLRLLTLLAELMCISECEGRFPWMGKKCSALAREVSIGMSHSAEGLIQQACLLKPDWLALLVVHQAISRVIQPGNVGMPSLDLVEACMALVDRGPVTQAKVESNIETDLDLAEPATKINKRNKTAGETRLHRACKKGNVTEIKKLLLQPHIDVNIADNAGWTPLHEAIMGGRESVETMLKYRSHAGVTVDVRAKNHEGITPLMDAAMRGKTEICELLLKYSGWCLLEDTRVDGLKAEDLARTPEIKAILAGSRLEKGSQMFNNLSCVDLPALATLLPVYLKLYLSTYKIHLVAWKMMHREALPSDGFKTDSKCFDFFGTHRSLKILVRIHNAAVKGSEIGKILRCHV